MSIVTRLVIVHLDLGFLAADKSWCSLHKIYTLFQCSSISFLFRLYPTFLQSCSNSRRSLPCL